MSGPEQSGDGLASFGRWLVRERELRALGRDEVVRATKLAPAVVDALESGEAARIPPHAYVVGYLRAYAAAVGLDADEVVLRFREAAAGPAGAPERARGGGAPLRIALAVLVAVAALGVGLWALLGS